MSTHDDRYNVNIFRPKSAAMKSEIIAIIFTLLIWLFATFGFQLWLVISSESSGSFLEKLNFFNLPFHYWYTAQLLPLLFVVICALYNFFIDRLSLRQNRKSGGFYE